MTFNNKVFRKSWQAPQIGTSASEIESPQFGVMNTDGAFHKLSVAGGKLRTLQINVKKVSIV